MTNIIKITGHNNFSLEKLNITAAETKNKAAIMKLYFIDLKNEITELRSKNWREIL